MIYDSRDEIQNRWQEFPEWLSEISYKNPIVYFIRERYAHGYISDMDSVLKEVIINLNENNEDLYKICVDLRQHICVI